MARNGYSRFSKAPELEPHQQMQFRVRSRTLARGGAYSSAEVLSAYSTVPTVNQTELELLESNKMKMDISM